MPSESGRASRALSTLAVLLLATLAGYCIPLLNWNFTLGRDWEYFNALSLIVRSNIVSYWQFPLHDPYVGGGLDLLANPQNRIFSPAVLLDIIFAPASANLASLVIYGFLGMVGMYVLLRGRGFSRLPALTCAVLFVNSSWFGLHFSEGHIPYGTFQLLPWVVHFALTISKPASVFWLSTLLAFFLLDGGMYPFIFSLVLLACCTALGLVKPWQAVTLKSPRELVLVGLSAVAFALLASAKLIPVLIATHGRHPEFDFTATTLEQIGKIFFYPFQKITDEMGSGVSWRFHEFGCYVGILATVLVMRYLASLERLAQARWLLLTVLFFWMGSGWGGDSNPWYLFQRIPLINNAHLQSRIFLLAYFCFLMMLAPALERLRVHRKLLLVLSLLLIGEATFVKAYPFQQAYRERKPKPAVTLIHGKTIEATIRVGHKPEHYFSGRYGSIITYEPALPKTLARAKGTPGYRGEIYFAKGKGTVSLLGFTPGHITVEYSTTAPGFIEVNTNYLSGWKADTDLVKVVGGNDSLLGVEVPAGHTTFQLRYSPWYLKWLFAAFGLGCLLWLGLLFTLGGAEPETSTFNYDGIPLGYYDDVLDHGNPIQRAWHAQKFERVLDSLPKRTGQSILDIGCFSGSFLSLLPSDQFSRQLGVDILPAQIEYARRKYGRPYREFRLVRELSQLVRTGERFDCVTSIEVIEHLRPAVVSDLVGSAAHLLKEGGKLVLTTPNYASAWPLLEWILNRISDVNYEEQHITRFNYFTAISKLRAIHPRLLEEFDVEFKTTTHFISPFLAGLSYEGSRRISRWIPHGRWKLPFGNLLLIVLRRKATEPQVG